MKIEQLLTPFLIKNKKFSLQDIGTFILLSDPIATKDEIQHLVFTEDSIQFTSDKNAKQDDLLIQYITENTKKIKPLATSDLESFTMLSKQFLNLGKPLLIEGLGSLSKNKYGIYEFTQANKVVIQKEIPSDFETKKAAELENKITHKKYNFNQSKKSNGLVFIIILLSIIIAGFVVYLFLQKSPESTQQNNVENPAIKEEIDTSADKKNTAIDLRFNKTDSNLNTKHFKIIVSNYNSLIEAKKGFNSISKLSYGKNIMMYTKDSIRFYLAVPMNRNITDTIKIKDSMQLLFGKSMGVELE